MIDRVILTLVKVWCFARYPRICIRNFKRSRVLPNPAYPVSYFDKYLWRKLFDHNPLFTTACDKLAAKQYALSVCPELKSAKVLWWGNDPASIPEELLTGSVVVKANHGSRWNVMVLNGEIDTAEMRKKAYNWVRRRYGGSFGEWGYKNATRCLFVEEMLLEHGRPIGSEYKFHVSGGRTAYIFVSRRNAQGKDQWCCYEPDGRIFPAPAVGNDDWAEIGLPDSFDRMLNIAEKLAEQFDQIRCDLYDRDGDVFFSELTAYPLSGQGIVNPRLEHLRNANWDLRKSWFLSTPQIGWRKIYSAALRRVLDRQSLPRGSMAPT
jgi:hypothetical protein